MPHCNLGYRATDGLCSGGLSICGLRPAVVLFRPRFECCEQGGDCLSDQLAGDASRVLGIEVPAKDWFSEDGVAETEIEERLVDAADRYMAEKAVRLGPDVMRMAEKSLLLQVLDQQWKEHLLRLDQLRQGISLRAYAQKDPLNE